MSDRDLLAVGRVMRPHGLRGLLRIRPYRGDTQAFGVGREVALQIEDRTGSYRIVSARWDRGSVLVALEGVSDRDGAEAWRGAEVLVPRGSLPPLAEDEVYIADCMGLVAVTESGRQLGVIEDLLVTPAHDIFVVRSQGAERLVPACPPFFVDLRDGRVVLGDLAQELPETRVPSRRR